MICKICNREFNNYKALSSHIRQAHKIKSQDYYIMYINSNHNCVICGKPTNFIDLKNGFRKHCCLKCSNDDSEKIEKQNKSFRANPKNIEQARKNIIVRNKSEKARKTSSKIGKRTGSIVFTKLHKDNDKIKWCDICKKDTKHIIGIGCMSCFNRDETHKQNIINTIKERYGEQYTNVYQVPEIKDKIIKTSIERYGITNPGNSREARIKANQTMRGNDNGSSCEDYFENALKELNISYKKQYKESRYPFLCDFYLIDFDIFIELNIYWSHNTHFFDETNLDDLSVLNKWTKKAEEGHKQYKNAIEVWTKKDIIKRDTAIKNKLNYVVLWTIDDMNTYLYKLNQYISIKV